jgi:hypothetical protein
VGHLENFDDVYHFSIARVLNLAYDLVMANEIKSDAQLVTEVLARLHEEQPRGAIPVDRLREEVKYAKENNCEVCVKIPSGWEFDMSIAEAEALIRADRKPYTRW